ncbi:hypothetical protein QCB45_11375 [Thiomicrorhabdus sp. ZW0627]|uniref:hypothetical protein n=1 Tax=Thiomicrorhabdus sp. ZW0627 TaxID=3039774 RepID=UPI002436CBC0|nr:hypothetical protein [Thiomicrorhabdus sp. ZW0627]MDG6774933.1 hypothetical protein [Thiomicrorhabdus sp. ZW0627]
MVSKQLSLPFQFYCLTEDSTGIVDEVNIIDLPELNIHTWWYKLYIFKEGFLNLSDEERILFLDLDVVIVNKLDSLLAFNHPFCISSDINEEKYNSSVMCFNANSFRFIWDSFWSQKEYIMERFHGDQDWIEHVYPTAKIYPKANVKSFKLDLDSKTPFSFGKFGRFFRSRFPKIFLPGGTVDYPKDASVVLFHGKPDPEDVMDGPYDKYRQAPWIKQFWLDVE